MKKVKTTQTDTQVTVSEWPLVRAYKKEKHMMMRMKMKKRSKNAQKRQGLKTKGSWSAGQGPVRERVYLHEACADTE